ncbi:MAG: hypothetical protein JSW55_02955 [Chloroflexota bacterium]|nr:MAG: hypothetical protein JSW55_02955 [Chloroflexota bacterium]
MDEAEYLNEEIYSVTKEDVERVLAVGKLLLSVLTPDELEALGQALQAQSDSQVEKATRD